MVAAFILVLVIVLIVSVGLVVLARLGVLKPKGKATEDEELDEEIAVEDLHTIVKHQYVTSPYNDEQVLAQVVCICGWQTTGPRKDYVKDQGDTHVSRQHSLIKQKRETARKVAEKLAENEKGDFAW